MRKNSDKFEIAVTLSIVVGLFFLFYWFPPYVIPLYTSALVGAIYGIFALIYSLREFKLGIRTFSRLALRMLVGGIMMNMDMMLNSGLEH